MKDGLAVSIPGAYAQVARLPELAVLAEEASWDGLCVQDGFLSLVAQRVGVSRGQQGCHSALQRFAHRCIAQTFLGETTYLHSEQTEILKEKKMKMNREEPKKWHFNPAVRRPYDAPSTWFEAVYTEAENDMSMVPWAGQTTQSLLLPWLERQQDLAAGNWRTLVVGCGLGDDAETLAQRHLHVSAFDISPRAIAWCRQRFPTSRVAYQVADLFDLPKDFRQAFTLVYEALTIQSLPPNLHAGAIAAIADCVAPGGNLLLMCCGRDWEEPTDGPPWPLVRSELACFLQHGLQEVCFQEHMLAGIRHFLVEYRKA